MKNLMDALLGHPVYSQLNYHLISYQIEENDIEDEEEIEKIMEEFYRTYLLSNRKNFNRYTREWSKANIKLIYMSLRAKKSRVSKSVRGGIPFLK